jgi:hypothetical protein
MKNRTIIVSLVLAVSSIAPGSALARHGADDNPNVPDDHGGQLVRDSKGGGSAKRVSGTCSGNATSKLKVKHDSGRVETEFEVDQNRSGVTWKVSIRHNGTQAIRTTATTRAPSGSFSVERRLADRAGTDRISARATSPSGQVCTAAASI